MRFSVEFEIRSGLGDTDTVREVVYKALVSALGSIDEFKILPIETYIIGYIQRDQPNMWNEVPPRLSDSE